MNIDWTDVAIYLMVALMILVVVLLIAVGVAAVYVSIPQLTEGVVVDMTFNPAHTSTYTTMTRVGKVSMPRTRNVHHAASWQIKVSGTTEEGEARAEWWNVGEAMYGMIEVGDRVKRDPETGVISIIGGKK